MEQEHIGETAPKKAVNIGAECFLERNLRKRDGLTIAFRKALTNTANTKKGTISTR
jgi:hypothetical protein